MLIDDSPGGALGAPAAMCITHLISATPTPTTKTFERIVAPDGTARISKSDYPDHLYAWGAREIAIGSIDDLARVVKCASTVTNSILVRGRLSPHAHAELAAERAINRQMPLSIQPFPSQVLMLDFDRAPLRPCADLAESPELEIEHLIYDKLPECFHDVRCFWQFSASAGFSNLLKCHLWFYLTDPTSDLTLRQKLHPFVDTAPFTANQPLYIVPPQLIGMIDPIPRRMGWLDGQYDTVDLAQHAAPHIPGFVIKSLGGTSSGNHLQDMESTVETIGDGLMGFHLPLRDAAWLYMQAVMSGQTPQNDEQFKNFLRGCINAAPKDTSRDVARYLTDRFLDDLVNSAGRKLTPPPLTFGGMSFPARAP
jgi:hypothetical protein